MWKWNDLKRLLRKSAATRDTADLGAIMWPVVYPKMSNPAHQPEHPHITVVIFNDIHNPDLGYTLEDVMEVVNHGVYNNMLWTKVEGVEWFGEEKNVPVLRVWHDFLPVFRQSVMGALEAKGIPVDMTFPEYKPHVTIPAEAALDGAYPDMLLAGPPEVWWGDVHFKVPFEDEDFKIALNKDGSL